MSVRILTADLLHLLADLTPTAATEPGLAGNAGILIHSDRIDEGSDPGKTDVLVGTSTNGITVGHTWTGASGSLQPSLWPIQYCNALAQSLKKLLNKDNKENHITEITSLGGVVTLQEDPDLFGNGFSQSFEAGKLEDFPRSAFRALSTVHLAPSADLGHRTPRIDLHAAELAKFTAIATRHGGTLSTFVAHHRLPVHVQIGWRYRGVIIPASWSYDVEDGTEPGIGVYPCELPDPEPKDGKFDLRTASGVMVGAATAGRDE